MRDKATQPLSDNIHGLLASAGDGEFRSPFSSRLWSVRASVQRGFEALYTVQVCEHCLGPHRCRIVLETSKFLMFAIGIVVLHLYFLKINGIIYFQWRYAYINEVLRIILCIG